MRSWLLGAVLILGTGCSHGTDPMLDMDVATVSRVVTDADGNVYVFVARSKYENGRLVASSNEILELGADGGVKAKAPAPTELAASLPYSFLWAQRDVIVYRDSTADPPFGEILLGDAKSIASSVVLDERGEKIGTAPTPPDDKRWLEYFSPKEARMQSLATYDRATQSWRVKWRQDRGASWGGIEAVRDDLVSFLVEEGLASDPTFRQSRTLTIAGPPNDALAIRALDGSGALVWRHERPIAEAGSFRAAVPTKQGVLLVTNKKAIELSTNADPIRDYALPGDASALAVEDSGGVWLTTPSKIVHVDPSGAVSAEKTVEVEGAPVTFKDITLDRDGAVAIGSFQRGNVTDVVVVRLDESGNETWRKIGCECRN